MKILIFRVEYIIIKMANYKFIFGRKAYETVEKIREHTAGHDNDRQFVHHHSL